MGSTIKKINAYTKTPKTRNGLIQTIGVDKSAGQKSVSLGKCILSLNKD